MSKTNALWQAKYEVISEAYLASNITREQALYQLGRLGIVRDADDHLDALDDEQRRTET